MLDLNRTMFYKVKFDVKADEGQDLLWMLVCIIRNWVVGKARKNGYEITGEPQNWSAFKKGSEIRAQGADVALRSWMHIDDGVYTWACQYRENMITEGDVAPRQWVTEVGFEGRSLSDGILSIVLSYGDRQGYIGPLQPPPTPSIPNLVKMVLNDKRINCTISGYDIARNPIKIIQDNAGTAFEMIVNANREIPIVLVTYREAWSQEISQVDPFALCGLLGPNALVCYVEDASTLQLLNNMLRPYALHCFAGSVRIYATLPRINEDGEAARHRYIAYSAIERHGCKYVYDILRRALAQDINFWDDMLRMEDVRRLNRESDHEKRIASLKERFADAALEEMVEAEERAVEAERERDREREENRLLMRDKRALELQCEGLKDALNRKGQAANQSELIEIIEAMERMPPTIRQIAELVASMHPNEIDFTEKGWASLDDCQAEPLVFREALLDMCTKLHPLFSDSFQGDVAKEFNSNSHFVFARGEGSMTRKDRRLMSQRLDTYQGRELNIEKHIKSTTGDPSNAGFLRIYFGWDSHTKKLVIGDCGGHKENYTTKKRK